MTPTPSKDHENDIEMVPDDQLHNFDFESSLGAPVEIATLTLPTCAVEQIHPLDTNKDPLQDEVVLHASNETATALAIDAVKGGGVADEAVACIQAVVDLTELSDLADATESEFVVGLHRVANDRTFNPNDSGGSEDGHAVPTGEKTPLVSPTSRSSQRKLENNENIHLDGTSFADAVKDTLETSRKEPVDVADIIEESYTTNSEENVHIGHDAFLIELPQKKHETEQRFVLALPEAQAPVCEEIGEEEEHQFPMLEKALSIIPTRLPTDIKDVQIESTAVTVGKDTSEIHLDMVIERQVPIIGYLILFFGFFALSSVGAALDLQGESVSPFMKTFWRLTATALALLPMAIHSLYREGLPKLSWKQWIMFPIAAMAYGQMTTAFVVALSMTSLANAFVFSNMTSLVIILANSVMGLPVLFLEGSGALIGFTGAVICSKDPSAVHFGSVHEPAEANNKSRALIGDLVALSASFGMAAYLVIARDLRSRCDLSVFMFGIFFLSTLFVLAYMRTTGEMYEFSRHPDYGLFGWVNMSADRLPLELYIVIICNIVGTLGYIAVLKYFDSVVVATVMLMEPVCAVFMGYWAGVDTLPGTQTWIGDVFVMLGSGLVIYSGSRKTETIDATKAIRTKYEAINIGSSPESQEQEEGQTHVKMLQTPVMMKRPSPERRGEM